MTENHLNIITVPSKISKNSLYQNSRQIRLREIQAKFERLWLTDSEHFNPLRNCMEMERLERTWQLLTKHAVLRDQTAVDLGCAGVFSRRLRDAGANVEAFDIAENALKKFREIDTEKICLKQNSMPITHLPDHRYQVVICTDLIAELSQEDYCLFLQNFPASCNPKVI
jgi:2-polyprenyl-3-methyl-5-hydroxy-6-metoxy-1,4-benzoquinol methylase